MYTDRFKALTRSYNTARRDNSVFEEAEQKVNVLQLQMDFLARLQTQLKAFDLAVTDKESEWRQAVLSVLETRIMEGLSLVYPTDGYVVKLSTRVLRGKIHIDASVRSAFADKIPGSIDGTQGRLFQQVVSFNALEAVMGLIGIKTLYVDEAFSGSSKRNIKKLNGLLQDLQSRGLNLVMIAQDKAMADGIGANRLFLQRSLDNKTTVLQEVERT